MQTARALDQLVLVVPALQASVASIQTLR